MIGRPNIVNLSFNIGFLLLIAIGAFVVGGRQQEGAELKPPPPTVLTTRSLTANHLLQDSDLFVDEPAQKGAGAEEQAAPSEAARKAIGELAGRYLLGPAAKGKPVRAGSVAERPLLSLDGGAIALGLAVSRKDVAAGTINAGTEALACSARSQVTPRSFTVEAVLCGRSGATCIGIVRLPPAEREIASTLGPGLAPRLSAAACDAPA